MSDEFRKIPRSYTQEIQNTERQSRKRVVEGIHDSERDFGSRYEEKNTDRPNWIRISVISLVSLGLATVGVLVFKARHAAPAQDAGPKPKLVADSPLLDSRKGNWKGGSPREVAERFLAATTDEERLRWVKDPLATADIMKRFYQDGPGKTLKVTKLTQLPQNIASQDSHARFAVSMDDGSARLLCVPFHENGEGKVDFKCYSLYGTATWKALLDGSATKSDEVRVIIERSNYYNGEFTDEKKWLSLVATSPDLEDIAYFYVPRDRPEMGRLLSDPLKGGARFTLGIESIGKSYERRQFAITRALRGGWLSE
jgi:hypothetical protein